MFRFPVNVKAIRWEEYIKVYVAGIRQFILRDEITSLDKAKQKLTKYVKYLARNWLVTVLFSFRLYWGQRLVQCFAVMIFLAVVLK